MGNTRVPAIQADVGLWETFGSFGGQGEFGLVTSWAAPGASRGGPNEPQARPGRPQERPKSPQDGSKSRPERAKRRPRPPRTAPGEHPRGPSRPDASWELFGSPFGPHLGAPGAPFSSFLGVLFEPRARSARQTTALVEINGQKVFRDRCGPDVQRPLSTKLLN